MKKFNKDFLKNVLQFSNEDVELVMECQKIFPELLTNEATKIQSVKKLYDTMELTKAHWKRWCESNIVENEFFRENIDWNGFALVVNGNETVDFSVSIDFAKHLVMQSKSKNSYKFRNYFILIEKSIKGKQEHLLIREPEKENYNKMKEEIIKDFESKHTDTTEMDRKYLMIRESNMINTKLIGYTAGQVREKLGYKDAQTREHLLLEQNKVIDYLELIIYGLVVAGIDFESRSKIIGDICKSKYPNLRMDLELVTK